MRRNRGFVTDHFQTDIPAGVPVGIAVAPASPCRAQLLIVSTPCTQGLEIALQRVLQRRFGDDGQQFYRMDRVRGHQSASSQRGVQGLGQLPVQRPHRPEH